MSTQHDVAHEHACTFIDCETGRMHNPALQPTANPLRGLSAAELGR